MGASDAPQFIAFSKAAAVITFSPVPPPPSGAQPAAPSPARAEPAPRKPPPPVPGAARGPRTIEGTPVRAELSERPSAGPKPARRSVAPPADTEEVSISVELSSDHLDGGLVPEVDNFPSAEVFARGSAVETSSSSPLLIDVTPMSLRIETVGGYSDVLISANSAVPCEKSRSFLTASDNQTTVFIRVAQGESTRFAENTRLGELELSGLRPAPRGAVKILVTFELDADGILNVRARDKETNRETAATMRLLGTSNDAEDLAAMARRQAQHAVA
jgi:molecular chaperone DnaK